MPSNALQPLVALEISPLWERHHTGIPNVAKMLAAELLGDDSVDGRFVINRNEISPAVVERLVGLESGDVLQWIAPRAVFPRRITFRPEQIAIGIYPIHKWWRRLFPFEVQIVHDLTTVVTPQFQTENTVAFWNSKLLGDLYSSDLIVAVSDSTKADIRTYYPQLRDIPCIVSPLAPTTDAAPMRVDLARVEPYVAVLGTLEPRKNIETVFAFLAGNRAILDGVRFVFIGRWGWGDEADEMVERHGLEEAVDKGRIVLTGFVSDAVRDSLIAHARCVLYPSNYEGFGLPILEALSFGTPVVTGYGSSLTEAGGEAAIYCDVSSPESLGNALRSVLDSTHNHDHAETARRRKWAERFDWTSTYRRIRDAAVALAHGR